MPEDPIDNDYVLNLLRKENGPNKKMSQTFLVEFPSGGQLIVTKKKLSTETTTVATFPGPLGYHLVLLLKDKKAKF